MCSEKKGGRKQKQEALSRRQELEAEKKDHTVRSQESKIKGGQKMGGVGDRK